MGNKERDLVGSSTEGRREEETFSENSKHSN
jgi:hypothetical protein